MAISQRPSEYFGWYYRYNTRTTYSNFEDAGMDLFAPPGDQRQEAWLDLTNVLPTQGGGFRRRWGLNQVLTGLTNLTNPVRTLSYANYLDGGTYLLYTDGTRIHALTDTGSGFTDFGYVGSFPVSSPGWEGVVSRDYFYFGGGGTPIKGHISAGVPNTYDWGILYPPSDPTYKGEIKITGFGTGDNYTAPVVSVTDAIGSGSGATVSAVLNNGHISSFVVTAPGSGYVQPVVSISDGTGTGATAIAYTDLNSANSTYGQILAVLPAGPIALAGGRTYTFALQVSATGHTSDISMVQTLTATNQTLPNITNAVFNPPPQVGGTGQYLTPGWTSIDLSITLGPSIEPQVDTVLLLATSDGGSLENLYLVTALPLSTFSGGPRTRTYTDTLPDTYSAAYLTGAVLTTNDLYVSTDGFGGIYGIVGNLPPTTGTLYPIAHQGRLFSTDGATVYYSKSIVDVTTAAGLITSRWEESWPADNQLPIALQNETITALKSDGQNLHIGTTRNMYTCTGSDPGSFSVAANQFSETGVLSNELFTVVYSEGQPVGFMWLTPDYKVMWSDFNTYADIGTPVYPLLQEWDATFTPTARLQSFTYGPYNLVMLCYKRTTSAAPEFLVYETALRKWYRWVFGSPTSFIQTSESGPMCSCAYTHPSTGQRYLYFFTEDTGFPQTSRFYVAPPSNTGVNGINLYRYDPAYNQDLGAIGIGWNIQTTWQHLDDPQVIKVLNEIDALSSEPGLQGTIYTAFTEADMDSPTALLTAPFQTGILGNTKLYIAGGATRGRFFSFQFSSSSPGSNSQILNAFTVEHCPIARI